MAGLTEIREALLERAKTLDEVDSFLVTPGETEYDMSGVGFNGRQFLVVAIANPAQLDELLAASGEHSVKECLEQDRGLGGRVLDIRVLKASGYRDFGGKLGAEWTVEVITEGEI